MSIPKTTQSPWIQMANLEGPSGPVSPQPLKKKNTQKLEPIPEVFEEPVEKSTKLSSSSLNADHD